MEFIVYNAKVAVLLAVFYMFYRLLLARDTFHRANRIVLLATAVASFVLPLCVITMHRTVLVGYASTPAETIVAGNGVAEGGSPAPLWQVLVITVFWLGAFATLAHSVVSIVKVRQLIRRSTKHPQEDGTVIAVTDSVSSPFSWMKYIVMNSSDYAAGEPAVLAHERGHISAHHSWDVVLVDILTPLQWFNPAIWLLRTDLRAIHEFEADAAVLSQGVDTRQYQYLLIRKAVADGGYSIVNGFSHSTLKSRINMMMKKKSTRKGALKYLLLAPVVATALAMNAETVTDYIYNDASAGIDGSTGATVEQQNTTRSKQSKKKKRNRADSVKADNKTVNIRNGAEPGKTAEAAENAPEAKDGNQPLYAVDGKITSEEAAKSIPADQIKEMVVLKGEAATSKYGDKGSSGVIEIYTKGCQGTGSGSAASNIVIKGRVEGGSAKSSNGQEKALLYIVDGKPLPEGCNLNDVISSDEIKAVTVYKDKEHTAQYGERAKDGVIVIERKAK